MWPRLLYVVSFLLLKSVLAVRQDRGKLLEMRRTVFETSTAAVLVNISLTITKMKLINLKTMEVQYDLLLHQRWVDERNAPDELTRKLAVAGAIWKPKVTFSQGQARHDADDATQFWRGWNGGYVLYSERYNVLSDCTKNFHLYPFDKQRCFLKISTFRFPKDEVYLKWKVVSPVEMLFDADLNTFQVADLITFSEIEKRTSGNFTVLVAEILLSRRSSYLLVQGILPSVLLVFISYLTYWLDVQSQGSRITLPLLSTLAMLAVEHNLNSDVPQTTYIKPTDVWSMLCCFFTFLPLLETVLVSLLDKAVDKVDCTEEATGSFSMQFLGRTLDRLSRFIHMLLFLCCAALFAVCYMI